jgi:hypothetical protein
MATAGRISAGGSLRSTKVVAAFRLIATVGTGDAETGELGGAMATGCVTAGAVAGGRVSAGGSLGSTRALVALRLAPAAGIRIGADAGFSAWI